MLEFSSVNTPVPPIHEAYEIMQLQDVILSDSWKFSGLKVAFFLLKMHVWFTLMLTAVTYRDCY